MSDADALRRAISAHPDDDLPRLALADLLDESGDPARAEFIRAQVALAQLPEHHPDRPALEDREHDILAANEAEWLGDYDFGDGPTPELFEWEWERGFLNEVAATPLYLLDHGLDLFAAHPVRRWRVMGSGGVMPQDLIEAGRAAWADRLEAVDLSGWFQSIGELERFLIRSDLARLRELDLTDRWGLDHLPEILGRAPFRDQLRSLRCEGSRLDLGLLTRALGLAHLQELGVRSCALEANDLEAMLEAPSCETLTDFDVSYNPIGPEAETTFQRLACRLQRLDLSRTELGRSGLGSILASRSLAELRALDLTQCWSAAENVLALADSVFWQHAESLRMAHGTNQEGVLGLLLTSEGPRALRTLDLSANFLSDRDIVELCRSPFAQNLTWMSLSDNFLTDEAARTLANSGLFTHLRTLHLAGDHPPQEMSEEGPTGTITDAGAMALANSPSLANLRVLVLTATGITTEGVDAILNGLYWRLSGLGVGLCDLSPTVVGVLASSPRLARLNWLDLSGNPQLGGLTLAALAESEYLCPLTELDIRGVNADDTVIAALRSRLGRRLST
jgi:uncharacterized protein (TIGR02996 family)